jgi:phosphoinositide-3-kinase, regulatory subunit 4
MGVRHTTLASLNATSSSTGDDFSKDILEVDPWLSSVYQVDRYLFPGSGRMMRTFRLKHKQNGSQVVAKLMWLTQEELDGNNTADDGNSSSSVALEARLHQQQRDLTTIQQALQGEPHMAPFLYWFVGPYRPYAMNSVRPAILLRPHFYTTLSDRLASRPFLTHVRTARCTYVVSCLLSIAMLCFLILVFVSMQVEKLWIVHQLLEALDCMHSKGIVHGFLTTENIGLSSWNWVVLVDFASYKARTTLPDDDPSEYLYYYQELFNQQGSDSTPREKRCYLAPERFYTPGQPPQNSAGTDKDGDASKNQQPLLTPAMDIFSAGCIIMETFLNGERALDLGDLMEYRKQQKSQTLQQKLNKIEFSTLRAACRHMMSLDPSQRLSAKDYLDRLKAADLVPDSFETLSRLMNDISAGQNGQSAVTPDERLAKAAAFYAPIIYQTIGVYDEEGKAYFEKALGANSARLLVREEGTGGTREPCNLGADTIEEEEKKDSETDNLLVETEALLKQLETWNLDEDEVIDAASKETSVVDSSDTHLAPKWKPMVRRPHMSQSSLLVYLQLVLCTVRHVQRPASKLVALQLMERIGRHSTDEARLQRIVPVAVSLLQDQDPLVRAFALKVVTMTISIVGSFPPSDSKVFPQYIFKRVAHLATDPSLVVRLSFAKYVATLAETSHRFLDISHAVRLYEAVGGSVANQGGASERGREESSDIVFGDDVANLLNPAGDSDQNPKSLKPIDSSASDVVTGAGKTLISSTYNSELGALHETVSRWVVHITTDVSEHSSPAKRALLADMARLCTFFGLDGVMAFLLPQVLSFLNDRKDWLLRATLFKNLTSVCQFIGRAATEHFVLPILETGLADTNEVVISRALQCLSELLQNGLLSRGSMLGRLGINGTEEAPG